MFDLTSLIQTVGYLGFFCIIFSESGLFFGFFFPGDSLLFTAGFLASQGFLNISLVVVLAFLGAVLGDSVGYAFGKKIGPRLFAKEDSLFFHKDHLVKARVFFEKHGPKTIVLARFLPVVRSFAPIVAGMGQMHYRTFLFYNILGGALWGVGFSLLGYFLGNVVPGIERYFVLVILAIVMLSILPTAIHLWKAHRKR